MILGVGVDICNVARIRRSVDRLGDLWIDEIFAPAERTLCHDAQDHGLAFAIGFACKEACAKALGTGFKNGVHPRDIALNSFSGPLLITLTNGARRQVSHLAAGRAPIWHVQATQQGDLLVCTAVLACRSQTV